MKIAILGSNEFDSLEYHIHDELRHQGHSAEIFDFIKILPPKIDFGVSGLSNQFVEFKNKHLLKRVLDYQPDLVIGVYRHIHPMVVKEIKQNNIKIIHVNPDQLTTLQNQQIFVEPYDIYYSKDPYMVKFMSEKLNLNAKLYFEAFNERIHKRIPVDPMTLEHQTNIDVLCFGNLYPYRNRMLEILIKSGLNLTIYGNKAKYFNPFLQNSFMNKSIFGEEKVRILNGAKIVFNNFHYAEIESVNNKFFEINGCGAFQICDYKPILNKLLPIDPKLVSFESTDDAVKLLKYFMDKPEKRFEIRDTIMAYFIENYSYKKMINNILS
jgi:spore maturation protein CgeB